MDPMDKDISVTTKTKLVKAIVFPVASYGCESWTTKKAEQKKIAVFEMWCWRKMLRVSWTEKRTNASIMQQIGTEPMLLNAITKQKLTYFGHVMRAEGLEKSVMMGMGDGQRNRGRPRKRWLDEVKEVTGQTLQELKEAVLDRDGWRKKVAAVTTYRLQIILANSLVSWKLDYCNPLYYKLPACSRKRLPVVQNALVRVAVPSFKRYHHHLTRIIRTVPPTHSREHGLPTTFRETYFLPMK